MNRLDHLDIPYFLTGSWSSSLQGEPRSTHDVDIVVVLNRRQVSDLLDTFPKDRFYVSESAILDAIQNRSMFNVLDTQSGDKIDYWMLTDEPWDQSRFKRRVKATIFGNDIFVSSPEDTIIAKLRWAMLSGGSEKQMNDARGVYQVQANLLDVTYIESWCQKLNIINLWNEIKG